jgi:hypothetical protein
MRGLHTSLVIVVAAIVILVVALIVLTVFGVGIGGVADYLNQRNICVSTFTSSCSITGERPPTWDAEMKVNKDGNIVNMACSDMVSCVCLDREAACVNP